MGKRINFLKHLWNAFDPNPDAEDGYYKADLGPAAWTSRIDRTRLTFGNEQSIIASIYTRIGIDAASVDMRHVRLDDQGRYAGDMDSGLQNCLQLQANIDQGARAFRQDCVMSLLDEGCIAIVPVDTTIDPSVSGNFDIKTLRVGRILTWYPYHVTVRLYNQDKTRTEDITLEKKFVAIVENPLYSVMNEPISTLRRLIRKLNMLDAVDEASSSGKLDLIIQLPYVIKSEARRQQAEQRRKDIEFQLQGSTYGIAYTDGTEKITQLNRPADNNLLDQITYLTTMLYSQLGLTDAVMNGTADEATMNNYYTRTIKPILDSITEAMRATFLTKTARTQQQSIQSFRQPFLFSALVDLAPLIDVLSRNQIMAPNEIRGIFGVAPSSDPQADQLINSNMPQPGGATPPADPTTDPSANPAADPDAATSDQSQQIFSDAMQQANDSVDEILKSLGASTNASG